VVVVVDQVEEVEVEVEEGVIRFASFEEVIVFVHYLL
jgi:hypothetical protein